MVAIGSTGSSDGKTAEVIQHKSQECGLALLEQIHCVVNIRSGSHILPHHQYGFVHQAGQAVAVREHSQGRRVDHDKIHRASGNVQKLFHIIAGK